MPTGGGVRSVPASTEMGITPHILGSLVARRRGWWAPVHIPGSSSGARSAKDIYAAPGCHYRLSLIGINPSTPPNTTSSAAAPITPPQLPSSVSAPAPTLRVAAVPELVTPVIVPVPDQPVAPIAAVLPVVLPAGVPIRGSPYAPSMDPPTVVVQRSKVRIVNCDQEDAIVLNFRPDQDTVFDIKELILASTNWFENLQPSRICIFDKAKGQGKVDSPTLVPADGTLYVKRVPYGKLHWG
ncbi:hypothetical protein BDK51DRAFT_38976 [Blyttiomyces helicus]|uniref:Uncharacterized protein n=1 Tax=Blyttiomyces helicus TaxID=388810 RepID=A0A4P9W6A2_9FUNG|nr:hypothetical protein BDK51DRAFT_38976 [Blyttiomyces helicus]|eukprot:RKO87834.1 hypothetical protein BDK51DRAFT_38976 [Blyttiomyces helicus]